MLLVGLVPVSGAARAGAAGVEPVAVGVKVVLGGVAA